MPYCFGLNQGDALQSLTNRYSVNWVDAQHFIHCVCKPTLLDARDSHTLVIFDWVLFR